MEIMALGEPKCWSTFSGPWPNYALAGRHRPRNIEFLKRKAAGYAPAADGWDRAGRVTVLRLPNIGRAGSRGDARRACGGRRLGTFSRADTD